MKQFLVTIDDTNDYTPAQLYAELEACLAFEFDDYPITIEHYPSPTESGLATKPD